MSFRQFIDGAGNHWSVYDVHPEANERRTGERRQGDDAEPERDDRRVEERRIVFRSSRPVRLRQGWLCFESEGERRRLQPIPEKWAQLPDSGLVALLDSARIAPYRPLTDQSNAGVSRR